MNEHENKIENIFYFVLLLSSLYLGCLIFLPFLQIILFSVLIAIVASPIHKKIKNKVKNESLASLFSTLFVFMFVLIPGTILLSTLISQLIQLTPEATKFFKETKDFNNYISNLPVIGALYEKVRVSLMASDINIDFTALVKNHFANVANYLIEKGKNIFTNVGIIVVGMAFVLMTIYFLFRDGHIFYKKLYDLVPLPEHEKTFLFDNSIMAIKAIFMGTILTAFGQSLLGFIAYLGLGIKYSIFWGFATFITAFIPLGGAALIWAPLAIYCFFAKGIVYGVILTLWGFFGISMVDNILRPILIGGKTNINTLIMVFTILGGIQVFGFIGIFIAPVIIVLIGNLLNIYQERYRGKDLDDVPIIINEEA